MSPHAGCPGAVGCSVSAGAPTRSTSRLGPPLAVVELTRTVLAPAASVALSVSSSQAVQSPVPGNDRPAATTAPLTAMSIGRSAVVPLAYRRVRLAGPAAWASTVNWTELPTTLSMFTKQVPV